MVKATVVKVATMLIDIDIDIYFIFARRSQNAIPIICQFVRSPLRSFVFFFYSETRAPSKSIRIFLNPQLNFSLRIQTFHVHTYTYSTPIYPSTRIFGSTLSSSANLQSDLYKAHAKILRPIFSNTCFTEKMALCNFTLYG